MKPSQENSFCQLKQPTPNQLALYVQDESCEFVVPLGKNFYSIGRDPDQDIRLSCQGISRYHASLILLNHSYYIVDGDPAGSPSKNGISVNGKVVREQTLAAGDKITFCRGVYAELVVHASDDVDKSNTAKKTIHAKDSIAEAIPLSCGSASSFDLFHSFPDLIIKLDVDGHVLGFQNAADVELPKLSCQHLERSISECFSIDFSINLFQHIRQAEKSQSLQMFEASLPVNNNFLFCEVRVILGLNSHKIVIIRNIYERKKLEQKLLMQAAHDSLTGLPNRSFFMEKVAYSVYLKQNKKFYNYAVFFVDLDRFKIINDSLGHLAGDRLLIEISMRLKACLRPQDTVARLGGDEFAILLHDIKSIDDAIEVAERLQEKLAIPLMLEGREIFPSASVGIAFSKTVYNSVEDIIKDADIAMYRSKAAGRSRYTVFEHEGDNKLLGFLQLDSALKRAIERQEFVLHYQSIFDLKTQKIIGLEALIRWNHPQKGLLEPQHFFEQAEETGLTDAIGKWTLRQACRQLKEWEPDLAHDFPMFLSINISKRQFSAPDFVAFIRQLISRYQVSAHRLKLEVAEATIMADIQASMATLKNLENLGVKILIDDFGVGYSSLSYLNNFPIDALKIDQSFIDGMDNDATSTGFTIIQSIIGLAHNLGVEVIAEGIECARHVAWLRMFNCDYGQGFYFSKAVTAQQITPLLKAEMGAWCVSQIS
jgi:diguanylate cyclase (GGDEF)-like protein